MFAERFRTLKSARPLIGALIAICLLLAFAMSGSAQAGTEQITFAWEQTITPDFGGWKIYSSPTAGGPYTQVGGDIIFTAAQTTYTHQAQIVLPDNAETTLFFIVRAFDKTGNLSGPSNEVSHVFDFVGPPAPGNLNITLVVTARTP
jgi:hypothetical protein